MESSVDFTDYLLDTTLSHPRCAEKGPGTCDEVQSAIGFKVELIYVSREFTRFEMGWK